MRVRLILTTLLSTILLAHCGGGDGDGDDGGTGQGSYSVSGTVNAASNIVVDSDTNDPDSSYLSNDFPAQAQAIGNPVMVGGFVTATPTFGLGDRYTLLADPDDVYAVDLTAGQTVSMEVANAAPADLDLGLYDAGGVLVDVSLGVSRFESVTAPSAGRYFLRVNAFSGRSNYVLSIGTGAVPATTLSLAADFVTDEAVVQVRPGSAQAAISLATAGYQIKAGAAERPMLLALGGVRTAMAMQEGLLKPAKGFSMTDRQAAKLDTLYRIKALRGRSDLSSADPNYVLKALKTPNDPHYSYQWHYPLINLPQAWDITTGTPASGEVVVAVVDTGVFLDHADLSAALYRDGSANVIGYDFIRKLETANDGDGIDPNADDPGDESTPSSSSWHGTHVAGTVAARSNNGVGVAGVSWGARIMPVRVIGKGGGSSYDVIQGIRYAAGLSNDSGTVPPKRADVINLSLGCLNCYSATEQTVYNQVRAAGSIVVAAAGNENSGLPGYPASYGGVVSVSAVAMDRGRAPYSNYGPTVDVAAPGGDTSRDSNGDGYADGVLSSLVGANRTSDYRFYQGTSMAAPHMAGVIALMKAVHPGLTPDGLDALLSSGALTSDMGPAGRDDVYGWGLIDAVKAVQAAQAAATGVTTTTLSANPSRLDFGTGMNVLNLELTRLGSGSLSVTGIGDDASWLSVSPASVDGNGIGSYAVQVDRSGLSSGSYSATVTATSSTGSQVKVPISMQVMTTAVQANHGRYYILLLDTDLNLITQVGLNGSAGRYDYRFDGLAAGRYFIYAGTDSDWDDFICDTGEVCGAYPTLGTLTALEVTADRQGVDFSVGFVASPSALDAAESGKGFDLRHNGRSAAKGVSHD